MTTIYLAAPYRHKELARKRRDELVGFDYSVSSGWLQEPHDPEIEPSEPSNEEVLSIVERARQDILVADFFLLCNDLEGSRGGCMIEFGLAWSVYVPIIVVGELSNIFLRGLVAIHQPEWDALDLTYQLENF